MSTRRHQKSDARREKVIAGLVTSCMAEFQEHAHEARHFLVVCSIESELARERDSRDASLDVFRGVSERIESLIRDRQWPALHEFVSGLTAQPGVALVNTPEEVESALENLWRRFSGFSVGISSSVVWLAEPRIYYLLLWRD